MKEWFFDFLISLAALVVAIISIIIVIVVEYVRRPLIEFVQHRDMPTAEDERQGKMWYHLSVRNKEAPCFFNRDAALQCIATVDFLDVNSRQSLVQIRAHWVNQPEPRQPDGIFDYSKIPTAQRIDVGFRPESFDVLLKFEGQTGFYAADPWIVYRYPLENQEWERLRIEYHECIVRAEIESINLGKRKVGEYLLRNKGTRKEDIELVPVLM
jgi:hypothetical protein